ncbi:MAG: hypothetical protein Q9195_002796 [Heterodermia aff. obscurata]
MARNAITSISPQSSPNSPTNVPPNQQRRMACTHITMEREYGDYRCMICRRIPNIGWIYKCTQDEAEMKIGEQNLRGGNEGGATDLLSSWLAEADADGTTNVETRSVTQLSPWVEKAILEGHYTHEQEFMLRKQKQNVNDKISAAMQQFTETEAEASSSSHQVQQSPSVDANSYLPFPVINQVNHPSNASLFPSKSIPAAKALPFCEHRACHSCRSTFRDRTWQSFDALFAAPSPPAIDFAVDNRPLSSPLIMAAIGKRQPKPRRQRPLMQNFDSMGLMRPRSGKRTLDTAISHSDDLADPSDEENKGLRHTIKRAFREMLMSRRDSVASTNRSSGSTTTTTARPSRETSRRSRLRKEAAVDDLEEYDLGLWKEANDRILREASQVKLPGHDGHDGLDAQAEEVDVPDGVAVTEEGVDTGTADVIMSV